MLTSGGNRKPANAEKSTEDVGGRRRHSTPRTLADRSLSVNATVPVAFDPVFRVLRDVVHRVGHQLCDDVRQRGGEIGDDFARLAMRVDRCVEESAGRSDVTALRDEDLDDLAMFVDGAVDVAIDAVGRSDGVRSDRRGDLKHEWDRGINAP